MEYGTHVQHPPRSSYQGGAQPPHNTFKNANGAAKKRQLQTTNIVYNKGGTVQTVASLTNLLKGVTEPVLGLRYVWEYRSPSKSVPPHYQCKLCAVTRLQHDMLGHVKGWKHNFRYLKRAHADKVTFEEDEAIKDPAVRRTIKATAGEVEKAEGRGQLKVIFKEPRDVQAFKGLDSAIPKAAPPGMGLLGPRLGGGMLPDPMFPGEYPRGPLNDFPMGGMNQGFSGPDMGDPRRFSGGKGPRLSGGGGDGFGPSGGGREGFGMGGLLGDSPEEFRCGLLGNSPRDRPADRAMDRPGLMGAAPDSGSLPTSNLLKYLDSFRIENESDAQIVLKVTQKLTDVLMDYRLRSVSTGPSMNSSMNNMNNNGSSMSSMSYSSPPPRMSGTGNRYSGSLSGTGSRMSGTGNRYSDSLSGPSRYSDGPSRFYN